VLGCTHFPVLKETIAKVAGNQIKIVDSANTTATAVAATLDSYKLNCLPQHARRLQFVVTDAPERFARIATRFLGHPLSEQDIQLIDL
jgi:glutamate racemase